MNKIKYLAIILLSYLLVPAGAQENLRANLTGASTLDEIMEVVDAYYEGLEAAGEERQPYEPRHVHWKRWEWYMSGRLGPDGEFVDISSRVYGALRREQEKYRNQEQQRDLNSDWSFVGPSSSPLLSGSSAIYNGLGRVDRIAFHPTDSTILYIGTPAGGLYRSTNNGVTWVPITSFIPSLGISGIVVSHSSANIIYVLTGDGDSNISGFVEDFGYMRPSVGILKSTDAGATWNPTGDLPGTSGTVTGYRLVQDPNNASVLFAATSDGLYKTTNAGSSWVQVRTGRHYDVAFKPGSSTTVYCTQSGGFAYSTQGGDSGEWNSATFPAGEGLCSGRVEIAVAPTNTPKVYLLAGPVPASGQFCGLFLSTDSGQSFTRVRNTPNILGSSTTGNDDSDQSSYDLAIAASTNNSNRIATGGLAVWRSTNGGTSISAATGYSENDLDEYIHPDVHDLAYNPLDHDLYAATDGGIYRSTDYGETWFDLSSSAGTTQFYHLAGYDSNVNLLLGGCQDNGVKYRSTNSSAFYHINGADGFDVKFATNTSSTGYASVNKSLVKFTSSMQNTESITPTGSGTHWFKNIAVHNTDPDILIIGGYDIFKTDDGGTSWTNEGLSGSCAVTSCPSHSARFYVPGGAHYNAGSGGLYRSDDTGDTWSTKSGTSGFPSSYTKITDVAVWPSNSLYVWATFGGFTSGVKVVRSTNGGDSWTNVSGSLPNIPVNCVAVDNNLTVYIGTDIGVYMRTNGMSDWTWFSNNMPNVPVTEIVINEGSDRVRAATFGRGVWETDQPTSCSANVVVTGTLQGDQFYEASTQVSSTATVNGGIDTDVHFKGGNNVLLQEPFQVYSGSEFRGFISPCGTGGDPGSGIPEEIAPEQTTAPPADISNAVPTLPEGMTDEDVSTEFKDYIPSGGEMQDIIPQPAGHEPLQRPTVEKLASEAAHVAEPPSPEAETRLAERSEAKGDNVPDNLPR